MSDRGLYLLVGKPCGKSDGGWDVWRYEMHISNDGDEVIVALHDKDVDVDIALAIGVNVRDALRKLHLKLTDLVEATNPSTLMEQFEKLAGGT